MAAVPAPNYLTQHLARWVCPKTLPSVVLVLYNPIRPKNVRQHMVKIKVEDAKNGLDTAAQQRCATGFVVRAADDHLLVLTCAHTLDHVFTKSSPIRADKINELFNAQILCDHAETRYRHGQAAERQYVPAVVEQVDCQIDLLLLRVDLAAQTCQEPHPAIPIADNFPESPDEVVVVSWPPYRPRTKCVGFTSHEGRNYTDVFQTNPLGYNMMLSEVSVLADSGSSGAPMLNSEADAVGVLHGGAQSSLCYFTSLPDLRATLTLWGVIEHGDE